MLEFIIENKIYVGYFFELLAAVCGSYYLRKKDNVLLSIKYLVYFLWFVFIMDLLTFYTIWAYYDDYKTLPWLKDSVFRRGMWMVNSYTVYSCSFYSLLFIKNIHRVRIKNQLTLVLLGYISVSIISLLLSDKFFHEYVMTPVFLGTGLLLISIGVYFYEMMESTELINFKTNLLFYISVGLIIWYLIIPPIQIYSSYFTVENVEFISVSTAIKRYANVFMYGIFSFGFIYCAQEKQLPGLNKNVSVL